MTNIFTLSGYAKIIASLRTVIFQGICIVFLFFIGGFSSFSQVKNDFDVRYEADIRGELTFIANNIVSAQIDPYCTGRRRNRVCYPELTPNDPYNLTGSSSNYNDDINMQYIDIDGDASTFSSSSAYLTVPDIGCSLVRYAGLYWSAVYVNSDRSAIDDIKFRVPGGIYQDITADEILFDGNGDTDFGYYSPYAAYKDVTSIVAGLADPNGDYFVANVNASTGSSISGGVSGGWTMVVVYENPNLPGSRYITTFDGYAGIKSGESVDIPVNGFTTLPAPFSVNAKMGVAALEGDNRIAGDGLAIDAHGLGTFTPLSNSVNPANNFFNSNITKDDALVTDRNPNSVNTLGWDVDLFEIDNQFNNVIPNDATSAILRASSTQDKYDIFFASFDVEIIAPNIVLEKRVNTPGGDDITGQGVHLGQILDYVLTFENIGNDDGTNYTIRDILPVNVSPPDGRNFFNTTDFSLPPGVTYTYDSSTREVIFTIPDNLVQEDDPAYSIRMRVQVAENCYDFIDACSDLIQNLAYGTYQGVQNSAMVTDDPSVTDFNACGYTVPGATNFLLDDLSDCNFYRTVELCGTSALLNAGDGFDSYVWYRDNNGNQEIDALDTEIDDGDPDNDPSTITVNTVGTYIVDKIVADPCKGFKEVIDVQPFGSGTIPNPIIEFFNEVNSDADPSNDIPGEIVSCSVDNDLLPKIFLCGINDAHLLQVNIVDAQSIVWEQLDESSCTASGDDCANKALTCTWNQVGTGNNYILNSEGQYRLSVTYQNGCTARFYFNGFQNNLDLQYNKRDIVCNTPGNISITNLGNGYGYRLVDDLTNTILVPFSANNGPSFDFISGENGSYRVEVTQLDGNGAPIANACVFSTPVIGILDREVTYAVNVTPANCISLGTINIQINNADPLYEYEIRLDDGSNGGLGTLVDSETAQSDNNFTFTDVNAGDYIAIARTADGCSYSENVTIIDENDLSLNARVSQHITCREGNIQMESTGGQTPHTYAILSYVDENGTTVTSYPTPQDVPASEFQTSQIFDIYDPGDYTFVVVDRNNCFSISNTVSIEFQPAAEFNATTVIDVNCFGDSSGAIQYNLVNSNGYQLTYYLYDENDVELATNSSGYFSNLPSGNYAVVINQRKGSASCDYEETFSISAPTNPINGSAVLTQDYSCLQNGIIEAQNVTGGTTPYSYSIDGVNFIPDTTPNAHRFENLTDGTYTLTIRDDAGCIFATDPITITPLNEPSDLTFSATPPNCPALTSDVTVSVVDGNSDFIYEISAPASEAMSNGNNNVFSDLDPGTYTFLVTDSKGCSIQEDFTITPVDRINTLGQLDGNITCFGLSDGAITFNVTNFTTSYDYSVAGPSNFSGIAQTANNIPLTGLAAGTYTITVTDNDTNCTDTASIDVQSPTAALTLSAHETQPSCTSDGSVILTANDGWGGYNYELINPDTTSFGTNTNGSFSGLTQTGTYSASVTDVNGCVVNTTFVLNPAVAPVLAVSPNDSCYDDTIGLTLTANVTSGGDGNYEYNLNGGAFSTSNEFSGLTAGTYTIGVRDGKNCTDTETITIAPELGVTASADSITACGTDADITITAAGGDADYVYAVVADGTTPTATDFAATNPVTVTGAGDYDVYVRDNAGAAPFCEAAYDITVLQDAPVAVTPTVTDATCFGGSDGSIALAASGGEAPYTYSIDGGATFGTSGNFNNLPAASYDARVRDANNCETAVAVTVDEPAQLMAEAVQTQDYTCLQLAEITAGSVAPTSGGSGNYQYSMNGGAWTAATTGGAVFPDLTDGTYSIRVRDANNTACAIALPDIIIAPLPTEPLLATAVDYNCDGTGNITVSPNDPAYTYSIDGGPAQASNVFANVPVGAHTITVDYGSDCTVDTTADVRAGNAFEATITSFEDLDCNGDASGSITFAVDNFGPGGFEYSLDNFATVAGSATTSPQTISGLDAGNYTITVRDLDDPVAACTITLNQSISEPGVLTASNVTTQPTCVEDGSVIITANGGTGGFTYQITQPDTTVLGPQGSNLFTGLTQLGLHTILVTDTNGCTATDTFTLTAPSAPVASIDPASDLCYSSSNAGSATVVVGVSGGTGPFYYNINGGPARTSNTFTDLIPGNYTFGVRDSNGCTDDIAFTIEPQLTANVVLTKDIDCSVSPDAILDISVNGGYAPFTYELDIDGAGYSSYTGGFPFTTGTPGVYRFRVTDSQGCIATSNEVEVTPTVNPVATATLTDPACNGDSNGIIEINVDPNFGSSPYQISFEGSAFSNQTVYSGLTAGTYSYTVMDSRNCTYTDSVTLTDPALFDANVTATDVSCGGAGVGDVPGKIDINITSGGVPNFTYTLYDNQNNIVPVTGANPIVNTASTSVTFDGLDFGDYYVRILDANGCEYYENPVRVLASPFLTLDTTVIVDCATGGTVEVTADSGSGNYTFSIYDAANTPPDTVNPGAGTDETAIFNGLNAGQSYIFRVIDNDTGCSSYVEADIPALSGIDVVADPIVTDVSCFGDTNGTITFQIEGFDTSVTDIDYEIRENVTNTPLGVGYSGTVTQSAGGPTATPSETVSNIPPGDYVLFFREATSPFCSNTYEFRILEPNPVNLSLVDQNNGSCNQDANVTVLASGGNGSYTYAFVEDGTAPVAGDYTPNNYVELDPAVNTDWDVYVLDGNGCTIPPLNIVIAEDPSPVISGVVINQCAAEEGDFIIEITLDTEGIAPYSLSLNGGSFQSSTLTTVGTTHQFTNLSSGNYTVQVRDFNGCGNQIPLEIFPPTSITAEVTTQPTCLGNDGEAVITAYGGSGVYLYELFDSGVSVNGAPQLSPIFTGLDSGVYTAFVYDQVLTGCDASVDIQLEVPRAVAFIVTDPTPVSCFGASDGSFTVTLAPTMDNPPYTYQLFERNGLGILIAQGLPQASNIFNNLPASTAYVVRVYSGRGCQEDADVIIGTPAIIDNVTATVTEFGCSAGNNPDNAVVSVDTASITGGSGNYVVYEFVDDRGTAATGDDTVLQSGPSSVLTVTDTAGASLTINVYDDNGCAGSTAATVLPFDEMTGAAAAVTNTLTCSPGNDGEITVTATSSAGDPSKYEYSIDNGANYQVSNVFGGLSAGNHNFLARHVDTGCTVTASATLAEPNTFAVDVAKTSDVTCFGTSTGEVTFELVDAAYPGGFDWEVFHTNGTPTNFGDDTSAATGSEAANGPTATVNLPAGEYYVSVTQANNPFCRNIEYFNIAGPDAAITASTAVGEITCVPGNDGSIEITAATGGWGDYAYYVGTAAPTVPGDFVAGPLFAGLSAGTYQAWARDAMGCEQLIRDNIVLADPAPISAGLQVNQENCTDLQGEIEVVGATGGQGGNYTYQLIMDGTDFRAPQNTTVFTGLGAGSYQVRVTDQWGCTFTTTAELLHREMGLTATVDKAMDCSASPGGEITVHVNGGSPNLEFTATLPDATTVTQNNGNFTGLTQVGTYSFTVRDLDTASPVCQKTVEQTLDAPVNPVLVNSTVTNISCFGGNNGSIRANLDPATNTNPIYQYELYDISDLVNPIAGPQTNPLFTNLSTGDYQVKVISGRACEGFRNETITEPTELLISASATEFGCDMGNAVTTATITIDVMDGATTPGVSSGTPQYLYSINNVNFQSSNIFEIIDDGSIRNITVYVTDGNGCTATDNVTIAPLNTFTADVTQNVAISCVNPETVTISVTDDGNPHNYTFELLPIGNPNGTQTVSTATTATYELTAVGSYTFRVTDVDTGCYFDTALYDISPYDLIDVAATATTPVTCFDDSNGALNINITGYSGTYTYQVFDGSGNPVGALVPTDTNVNPRTISGLSGGNYFVRITETNLPLCSEDSNSITITSPDMRLTAVVTPLTEPTCTNDQGEILVDPSGGYAPYDVVLTNTTTGQTYTANNVQVVVFTGLSAGNFSVNVTDNLGCVHTDTEILDPATPIIANAAPLITDLSCYDDTGATVSAIVAGGGSGSYEYQLNYYDLGGANITFTTGRQLSPDFNDLGSGTYSITVSDGWNCDVETNTVEIREPSPLTAQLIRTDPLTCATGVEFQLSATGGSGSYEYSMDNISFLPMTSNPMGLPALGTFTSGTYQFYVRDAINGCEAVASNAITEDAIVPLTLTIDSSAAFINCTGEGTAVIYATADGGLGNYQYELFTDASLSVASRIAGPKPEGTFRDLASGTYYVSVTSEDCTALPQEVVITEPVPLSYTDDIRNVTCVGERNGSITVSLSGGTGSYQYAISPNLNQFDTINTFTNLAPGDYTVIAQDENGCFEYLNYTITEPVILTAVATTTPEICAASEDGSISLAINGGTAPYSTAINSNADADFVPDRTMLTDLAAGNYILFVRDANGCETNLTVRIDSGVNLNASIEPIYECAGDIPSNYINVVLEDASVGSDVLYALDSSDPNDMQLNADFRDIAPGFHYITIAHANGCINSVDFEIEGFVPLTLELQQNNLNEITAIASGGREGYTFYFDNINNGADNTFYITRTDTYEVTVVDENGCQATASIFIEFIDVDIPNFFTPDGDGNNDLWKPNNIDQFPEILIKIFDRYGREVARVAVDHQGWDGTYKEAELPTGDYWYIIQLNGEDDEREFVGHFTLYR